MAFRKGIEFVPLDEPEDFRPVLIYITAPISRKDFNSQTAKHKRFMHLSHLPHGVLVKDAKPYNLCLIEVNPDMEQFKEQISAAFGEYDRASHKVVIINAHGTPEGVLLKEKDWNSAEEVLDGIHLAELVLPHTDGHNIHVFVFSAHGHTFANEFYSSLHQWTQASVSDSLAISYFTSIRKSTSWDMVTTVGNRSAAVTQKVREFVKSIIQPNNPYRTLEEKMKL